MNKNLAKGIGHKAQGTGRMDIKLNLINAPFTPMTLPFVKGRLDRAFCHYGSSTLIRNLYFALAGCVFFIALILPAITVHAMSGREVYEKVHEVRSKMLDRKTEATMVLFDKGGGKRTRTLTEYAKRADPEAYKVLVVFRSPPDLKDVGFLIHARTFADRDLWAYFPEYKRVRRIPTTSQDDSFFGSDFSYDDFGGPPNLHDYKFSILK
jgi:hypothetical protein